MAAQIGLICTQPSGEIAKGAAEQIGGYRVPWSNINT
jgi:hypothetical protein